MNRQTGITTPPRTVVAFLEAWSYTLPSLHPLGNLASLWGEGRACLPAGRGEYGLVMAGSDWSAVCTLALSLIARGPIFRVIPKWEW